MTNIHMINELNNNTIFAGNAKKKIQLPDSVVDTRNDIGRIPGLYKNDDGYRPYTIYGNAGEFSLLIPSHFLSLFCPLPILLLLVWSLNHFQY